jgi:hypothetical protein
MLIKEASEPVPGFGLKFRWNEGEWQQIFDEQTKLIRSDIQRARFDGKIIVYLSCPISARGGGHARTNVEIAKFTERRLLSEWGERFWILNPAQYQLESKEGFGLLDMHAKNLGINLAKLLKAEKVGGDDYMRMWTQVLVEDQKPGEPVATLANTGRFFDAYYFLGPSDARAFFGTERKHSLGASIEEYFARKHSTDREFRDSYSILGLEDGKVEQETDARTKSVREWEEQRRAFMVYYALRVGVNYSLGSHDEWNIFIKLNRARRKLSGKEGIPSQIAGFFDGKPLALSAGETPASAGYAAGEV